MKKLISVALLLGAALATISGATALPSAEAIYYTQQKKAKIKLEALPAAVKKALREDPYTGWRPVNAYRIPGPDDTILYEIQLKKGPDMMKATFDKDGNKIV